LLKLHLQNQLIQQELDQTKAEPLIFNQTETVKLVNNLGFKLTPAQKQCAWQILQDMEKNQPMNRLLEGDVGSGKTVVAGLAILSAILNNKQAVVLAPTEILANQHFISFQNILKTINCNLALLTSQKRLVVNTQNSLSSVLNKNQLLKSIFELITNYQNQSLYFGTATGNPDSFLIGTGRTPDLIW